MTNASIDSALELTGFRVKDPDAIEEVDVSVSKMVYDMAGAPFKIPDDPQVDAQFSIPYTVAVTLRNGGVLLSDSVPDKIE